MLPQHALQQVDIDLPARPRGVHLITDQVLRALPDLQACARGMLHLLLQHTSAGLFIGENADPQVRRDLTAWLDRVAPDGDPIFRHVAEGPDDMPAHVKCALLGVSLLLPIRAGSLALGTWQGIYLGEFRAHPEPRRIIASWWGG